jgi:hypothetical protein
MATNVEAPLFLTQALLPTLAPGSRVPRARRRGVAG